MVLQLSSYQIASHYLCKYELFRYKQKNAHYNELTKSRKDFSKFLCTIMYSRCNNYYNTFMYFIKYFSYI